MCIFDLDILRLGLVRDLMDLAVERRVCGGTNMGGGGEEEVEADSDGVQLLLKVRAHSRANSRCCC